MSHDVTTSVLQIRATDGQKRCVDLSGDVVSIGRSADCDVQLESVRVSRCHAQLTRDSGGAWIIRDLDSRNGTRVNGQSITEHPLQAGDIVQIGEWELRLRPPHEQEHDDADTTHWSTDEPADADGFTTLATAPPLQLDARHLALVGGLGQRLAEIAQDRQRMTYLCRSLVEGEMRCSAAVVLRVNRRDFRQPPQLLCPMQIHHGCVPPRISRGIVEAAVNGERPILAGGALASGLTINVAQEDRGVHAFIACPLRVEPTDADVLYVTLPHQCGTMDWLALVTLAGEQLKKAQLQIEARQSGEDNQLLQRDLKKAREIQMALAPKNLGVRGLEIAIGFEPCRWIGGDYVNVLNAPDGRVFLAAADVSGKGLPAAMVATGVHSIVHAAIRSGIGLVEMVGSLNQYLLESMDRQSFVTMLGVMCDPASGALQCANAGHPPMLIVRPDGEVREMPSGHCPPLGVVPLTAPLDDGTLAPAELAVLFTDGLSELIGPDGKMLGVEGVKAQVSELYAADPRIPLKDLGQRLNRALDERRGDGPVTDDRSFLLARRTAVA
jgi:serine phosphatase RsbU (regulator of sigma subunit)